MYKRYDPSLTSKENLLNLVNVVNGYNLELDEVEFSVPANYPSNPEFGFCTMTVLYITDEGLFGHYPVIYNRPTVVEILNERTDKPCELEDFVFIADGNTPQQVLEVVAEAFELPIDQFVVPEEFPAPIDNTGVSYMPITSLADSIAFSGTFYVKIDHNGQDGCGCPLDKIVTLPELIGWSDGTAEL